MIVRSIKTDKILAGGPKLREVLDNFLIDLKDGSIVAVTSKIVAICENRVIPVGDAEKEELVKNESDFFIDPQLSKYGMSFTITYGTLIPVAGIDLSNGNGNYILWPRDPFKSANEIREYLQKRFGLKKIGVVITDSTARPLHYGTEGVGISYSGFAPNNSYIGKPDLFGRPLKISISNIADALAAAAVLVMGEGSEQTPIAIIEDVPFVKFQEHDPTKAEIKKFYLDQMDDDLFAPFLKNAPWQKGRRRADNT